MGMNGNKIVAFVFGAALPGRILIGGTPLIPPMGLSDSVATAFERGGKRELPNGVRREANLAYREGAGNGYLLDVVWTCEPHGRVPVVFYFNSGSFHRSNRGRALGLCSILSKRDLVVINCQFPDLSRSSGADAALNAVMDILLWTAEHAADYRMDLDRVYAAGSSYGALMAVWTALLCNTRRLPEVLGRGAVPFRLRGLGLFNGMTDTESGDRIMRGISKSIAKVEARNKPLGEAMRPWANHDLRTLPPVYQVTSDSDPSRPDILRMNALLDKNAVVHDTLEFDTGIMALSGFMEDHASGNECARIISKMFGFFAGNQ